MQKQARGCEHTTEAREVEVQQWLLGILQRYGPGKYLLQVGTDGRVSIKVLTPAIHVSYPGRLRLRVDA